MNDNVILTRSAQAGIRPYSFYDWKAGAVPPKSWDCADAVEDGWTRENLDQFMRETVGPIWTPKEPAGKTTEKREAPKLITAAGGPVETPQTDWMSGLICSEEGRPKPNMTKNWALFLHHHPQMAGVFAWDEFRMAVMLMRRPPWAVGSGAWTPRALTDIDLSYAVTWLEDFQLTPKASNIGSVIAMVASENAFHPVREYLSTLPAWDGTPRLDTWLSYYAGAEDGPLIRAFARKFLCAAVRRVKQPGSKFDHVLILAGEEGLGKSRLIRSLCPTDDWFCDQLKIGSDAKTTIEQASGAWLVEMAEMIGSGRREVDAVKHFVTAQSDKARKAYARTETIVPRQFVLFGTTNETSFLTSLTGNRRFWICEVGRIDIDALIVDRDQLWAEAVAAEPLEALYLEGDLYHQNSVANSSRTDYGAWSDLLDGLIPEGDIKLAVRDAWALVGVKREDAHKVSDQQRRSLQKALAGLGFDLNVKSLRKDGSKVKAYVRGDPASAAWFGEKEVAPSDW
ncbi:virulence-associated E family protein [Sinorhizobium meliloti]|uniref:virulence-associated E family protein n=1 Tax=Rhizobium meliloti TaxID=382 RepID=UPI000FD35568|nr:virulence-associated E family protein [Sinorhizobium meliloti]RVJ79209.1 hypothetical protein CN171_03970 [Sinorhizobium meliloti]